MIGLETGLGTGKEDPSNIQFREREDAIQFAATWREAHRDLRNKLAAGWYVKAHFQTCVCRHESMWVLLESAEDGMLYGELNNDPIIVDMVCGEKVTVCWDDLEGAIDPEGNVYN